MTEPCAETDPVSDIINTVTRSLRGGFAPDSACPPLGGGSTDIRFFAGDGAPLAAWDAHASGTDIGCAEPFLWVRAMRRYRSKVFPTPALDTGPCALTKVVAIEIGVGRCAVVDAEPSWEDYAREAEISLDDSWRIERVLCHIAGVLQKKTYEVGTDTIAPYGPEGGIIAWTGVVYVGF